MRLFATIQEIKDRRIITITESQMFNLILEAATIQDIYQKYYSNIPEDIFQEIISADPTYNPQKPQKMGKFGKWLLGIYLKDNLKTEDLYKATDYLSYFVKFNGKIQQKDIMKYKSLPELYSVVEPFISNPDQAATKSEEVRKIKEGAEKVYEDAKWMVIVPHTQEASCYYGKGTQWCTAATGSQNYFDYYNKKGLLYINILKGTDTKYQFHFETNSFMDATDTSILHPVAETIGLTDNLVNFYIQKYGAIACINLTTKLDTDHIKTIDKLPNYIYDTSNGYILQYNEQERKLNIVYTLNDGETINNCYCRRFISITKSHKFYECINLFDTKYNKLVFDENDNIDYIEFLYVDNPDRTEYINIHKKNDTHRIFSLKTMTYTSEEIGENYMVGSPLCEWNVDYEIPQFYKNDLAMLQNENYNVAFYSLSQGKLLSDFFKKQRTLAISYNLNSKVTELGFFVLYNEKPNEQDAILIMYDGKLYPLNIFRQNSNQILNVFFSNIQESKNRKINTITESQMFDLILETATIQDIYQKYYSNIPEDIFQEIISADPTYNPQKPQKMGKYGKWLLNLYKQNKLKTEDLYKVTDYLSYFVKYYNRIENKDINKISDLPSLFNVIRPFKEAEDNGKEMATSKSDEIRKIKEDAEKFYEDDTWLVIVPHSQEASCYYGKNTQWCTAATDSYNMFNQYYSKGLLYININKKTNKKYQFHFETNSFMDETDTPINSPITKTIGLSNGLVQSYANQYGGYAVIALNCSINWDDEEPIQGKEPFYLYMDYDGYYNIVQVNGLNVTPCKGIDLELTSENNPSYIGGSLFCYHDYEDTGYYDEEEDYYYNTDEYQVSKEWTIYNAKTQHRLTLPEESESIYKFNNKYMTYTNNGFQYLLDMNTMKIVFKSKHLIQDTQFFIKSFTYKDPSRKIIRYNDDLIVITSYKNEKNGGTSYTRLQYTIYDISKGRYILPPFNRYSLCIREDTDHNAYLAFKNDDTNSYCLLLSDGSLSEEYQ